MINKTLQAITILSLMIFYSCKKEENITAIDDIKGNWEYVKVKSAINKKSNAKTLTSFIYYDKTIYFQFDANNYKTIIYRTNDNENNTTDTITIQNTYSLKKNNIVFNKEINFYNGVLHNIKNAKIKLVHQDTLEVTTDGQNTMLEKINYTMILARTNKDLSAY